MEKLPFGVEVIQTNNGPEFASRFHYHVLDKGIGHVCIKPATPRLNGKVERSHRIDQEESYRMLEGVVIDDTELFNDRLQEWEDFYNYNRPHGGLGGQTPCERLRRRRRARCGRTPSVVHRALGRNRTCDPRFRKPLLSPLSYEGDSPKCRSALPRERPASTR